MSRTDQAGGPSAASAVYPAPSLVVGVGKFGLSVLERLGEDWLILRQSGADASLGNLRLLYVQSSCSGEDDGWKQQETRTVEIAEAAGGSDLPSRALDLAILRSLGLVRYRNGTYQVAVPRDGGVVERRIRPDNGAPGNAGVDEAGSAAGDQVPVGAEGGRDRHHGRDADQELLRRRYYDWLSLSPDPVVAVERLQRLSESTSDLDLFITPILNRVRQGHSPRTLISCIARCHAFAEGRDPSPWAWIRRLVLDHSTSAVTADPGGDPRLHLPLSDPERTETVLKLRPADWTPELMPPRISPPLPGWEDWVLSRRGEAPEGTAQPSLLLHVPSSYTPRAGDVATDLDPFDLLEVDWEHSGWATENVLDPDRVRFRAVQTSQFRLGLFDHDGSPERAEAVRLHLESRLHLLSGLVYQGLIRLWIDLQRARVEELDDGMVLDRRREHDDEALRQSLEVLGELLVRPISGTAEPPPGENVDPPPPTRSDDRGHRSEPGRSEERPSRTLGKLLATPRRKPLTACQQLTRRLAELDLAVEAKPGPEQELLQTVRLAPSDLQEPGDLIRALGDRAPEGPEAAARSAEPTSPAGRGRPRRLGIGTEEVTSGIAELRRVLNATVRELYRFTFLSEYRNKPVRRPPRLTVYLVGDMGEPFVRVALRSLLREIHAELLRSFDPIFQLYRQGFDRALAVVPILWMPHPSDPFEGGTPKDSQREEAAIIDAVHSVRRWVESVIPPSMRRVSQLFINSRVTDTAVLSESEAVRQTRDFISLQCRNEISCDRWLRNTAIGPPGDDLFASFACYQIEFPAERAREYLANRLGRTVLTELQERDEGSDPGVDSLEQLIQRPLDQKTRLAEEPRAALARRTLAVADKLSATAEEQLEVTAETDCREIERAYDGSFEDRMVSGVHRHWRDLTERRGQMDEKMDELRKKVFHLLGERLTDLRRRGDDAIRTLTANGGLGAALRGFQEIRQVAKEQLERKEAELRRLESHCALMDSPSPRKRIEAGRRRVIEAARHKPSREPMRFGLLIVALGAPVLGAPLAHSLSYLLGWHRQPTIVEPLLGPYGYLTGGLVLALVAWWFNRRVMRRAVAEVKEAVRALARSVHRLVHGGEGYSGDTQAPLAAGAEPSIRALLDSRLRLTATAAYRGFALQLFEQAERDYSRAGKLLRSVEVQRHLLTRQAEELGVRPTMGTHWGVAEEEIDGLFDSRAGDRLPTLIAPHSLVSYFEHRVSRGGDGDRREIRRLFLREVGELDGWRKSAPLSDDEAILDFGRRHFNSLIATPVTEQFRFEEQVGERLLAFVNRHYPNIGFGAKFAGSEGLDQDGVHVSADAALVLNETLKPVYEKAARSGRAHPRGLSVITTSVRPNAAYMLSLAQGIRAHSVRNLQRFESFHDRPALPDDRTFPLSGDQPQGAPINNLTVYRDLGPKLRDLILRSLAGDPVRSE